MLIQKVKINQINPAVFNPRIDLQPNDPRYQGIARSIDTFGCVDPLVWNKRTQNLVGGHQRFKILKAKGFDEIEVSVVDLSEEDEKALNLSLNKNQGDWDQKKLAHLLDEMCKMPDFDLGTTGFQFSEVSQLRDLYLRSDSDGEINEDAELEKIKDPVTKPGDLIQLNDHFLLCGDAADPGSYQKLLGEKKVKLVCSDPPYGVSYDAQNRPVKSSQNKRWNTIQNDNLNREEYAKWFESILACFKTVLQPNAIFYLWNGFAKFYLMADSLEREGFAVSNVITWVKPSISPGFADYQMASEFLLYGWLRGKGKHPWYGGRSESNVWQENRDPANILQHPTQKPFQLFERMIKNSSCEGDAVLDMFAGSGSTLVAAEKLKRKCFLMELSPVYCDLIVKRFARTFGKHVLEPETTEKYGKYLNSDENE